MLELQYIQRFHWAHWALALGDAALHACAGHRIMCHTHASRVQVATIWLDWSDTQSETCDIHKAH